MPSESTTLTMPGYRPRIADSVVGGALGRRGAVLIEGARGCGKTWTGLNHARSEARFDNEAIQILASADPAAALAGPVPRLLDECQNAPSITGSRRRRRRAQPRHRRGVPGCTAAHLRAGRAASVVGVAAIAGVAAQTAETALRGPIAAASVDGAPARCGVEGAGAPAIARAGVYEGCDGAARVVWSARFGGPSG